MNSQVGSSVPPLPFPPESTERPRSPSFPELPLHLTSSCATAWANPASFSAWQGIPRRLNSEDAFWTRRTSSQSDFCGGSRKQPRW